MKQEIGFQQTWQPRSPCREGFDKPGESGRRRRRRAAGKGPSPQPDARFRSLISFERESRAAPQRATRLPEAVRTESCDTCLKSELSSRGPLSAADGCSSYANAAETSRRIVWQKSQPHLREQQRPRSRNAPRQVKLLAVCTVSVMSIGLWGTYAPAVRLVSKAWAGMLPR